ncbi:hypothetical protein [Algoriphagus namhaensis]
MQVTWTFRNTPVLDSDSLQKYLKEQVKELEIFLSYYYKNQGATAENVKLSQNPEFKEQGRGILRFTFDIAYFNLCLNIDEKEKGKMKVNFFIDPDKNELQLIGEDWLVAD